MNTIEEKLESLVSKLQVLKCSNEYNGVASNMLEDAISIKRQLPGSYMQHLISTAQSIIDKKEPFGIEIKNPDVTLWYTIHASVKDLTNSK